MIILDDLKKCTGCGLCAEVCPKKCISMTPQEGGFLYPHIDENKCINCYLCRKHCPVSKEKISIKPLSAYAFKDKNAESRVKSASGGAAALFAKSVLEAGGMYTGVRYDDDFNVVHDACVDISEIDLFRDSKYVQSHMNGIFKKIKAALDEGKQVVATGVPCQIAAFRSYFQDKYENLILCDLICHGVPSPLVFQCYLKNMEKSNGKSVKNFYFRDKTNGWHKNNVKIIFDDGSEQIVERKDCDFYRLFGNNMIFRKSCHNCNFRNFNIYSDITIGDYWGIEKKYPDFADETGCSVVMINTQKGQMFFDKVKEEAEVIETGVDFAIETHPKLIISIPENVCRDDFFRMLKTNGQGFNKAVNILLGCGVLSKLFRLVIKIKRRIKK